MYKPTKEQIAEWKAKHGEIYKVTVEDKCAILKAPDRKTLSAATSVGAKDPIKFNETILNNCWLAGDEEIRKVDSYFLGAGSQLQEIIEVKEASLEKL
jgi:hypothetical protein